MSKSLILKARCKIDNALFLAELDKQIVTEIMRDVYPLFPQVAKLFKPGHLAFVAKEAE